MVLPTIVATKFIGLHPRHHKQWICLSLTQFRSWVWNDSLAFPTSSSSQIVMQRYCALSAPDWRSQGGPKCSAHRNVLVKARHLDGIFREINKPSSQFAERDE